MRMRPYRWRECGIGHPSAHFVPKASPYTREALGGGIINCPAGDQNWYTVSLWNFSPALVMGLAQPGIFRALGQNWVSRQMPLRLV